MRKTKKSGKVENFNFDIINNSQKHKGKKKIKDIKNKSEEIKKLKKEKIKKKKNEEKKSKVNNNNNNFNKKSIIPEEIKIKNVLNIKFKKNSNFPPIKKNKFNSRNKSIALNSLRTNGENQNKSLSNSKTLLVNIKNGKIKKTNEIKEKKEMKKQNDNKNKLEYMKVMKLNDYELNTLVYKDALVLDKRTYIEYYLSLLKTKHLLIFTFFNNKDYNSTVIKICLYSFSSTLYYTINALFFGDSTLHKINQDKGSFNLNYQIPQIFYSSLITFILNIIVKSLSLTERNIIKIKQEKYSQNMKKKGEEIIKFILIKSTLFFVLTLIFLLFFWYYLSCFSAIYKNTQLHLIKDTLISYGLSMLYPFVINIFPGIFRIPALRNNKKNKELMFKISNILQYI